MRIDNEFSYRHGNMLSLSPTSTISSFSFIILIFFQVCIIGFSFWLFDENYKWNINDDDDGILQKKKGKESQDIKDKFTFGFLKATSHTFKCNFLIKFCWKLSRIFH